MSDKKPTSTNAVIYARFSPRKNPDDCTSCEVQIETCRAYCKFKDWKILGVYQDDNLSGKSMKNRTGLHDAMNKAIIKDAHIISYSLSRLTRSLKDAIEIIDNLKRHNLGFVSCREGYDTSTFSGRMVLGLLAVLAEWQRESISELTKDKLHWMAAQGLRVSARPPWGKQNDPNDPKRVIDNNTELAMMRRILAWHKDGKGQREICRLLDEAGFKARTAWNKEKGKFLPAKWHHTKIKRIIERAESLNL